MEAILSPRSTEAVKNGEVWLYASGITRYTGSIGSGAETRVLSSDGTFLGKGFFNPDSKIAVRLLTRQDEPLDEAFFTRRLRAAGARRARVPSDGGSRLVASEADMLSGLTVDRYADTLVLQITSLGLDRRKEMIVRVLVSLFSPKGIYERDDLAIREKEGLPQAHGLLYGTVDDVVSFKEDGLVMSADVKGGQKTGYYLDQQENRALLARECAGKNVLDLCSNEGGFALQALAHGASRVTCVDLSARALSLLAENARRNALSCPVLVERDALSFLKDTHDVYDVIILDPPPFVRSRETLARGLKGYRSWNEEAIRHLAHPALLYTASCSEAVSREVFRETIKESCALAGRYPVIMKETTQPFDHPALLSGGAGEYLKSLFLWLPED